MLHDRQEVARHIAGSAQQTEATRHAHRRLLSYISEDNVAFIGIPNQTDIELQYFSTNPTVPFADG